MRTVGETCAESASGMVCGDSPNETKRYSHPEAIAAHAQRPPSGKWASGGRGAVDGFSSDSDSAPWAAPSRGASMSCLRESA